MSTDSASLVEVNQIWGEGSHNAFTDLLRHEDKWYCVFREGKEHASFDGQIRVLVSTDGKSWRSVALLDMPSADLRDPKISRTPENRLMIVAGMRISGDSGRTVAWFSFDGINWGRPTAIAPDDEWLWRVTWYGGVAYAGGYNWAAEGAAHHLRLYTSRAGRTFQLLGGELLTEDYPNETTLIFREDGACYALARRDAGSRSAMFGTAPPPYTEWTWQDTGMYLGGPDFVLLPDGRLLAAGRVMQGEDPRTALLGLDPATGQLTELLTLPSGGDTSYPGLALHEGMLWVSYYSSHEGPTSVYLAKVQL